MIYAGTFQDATLILILLQMILTVEKLFWKFFLYLSAYFFEQAAQTSLADVTEIL